jgi:hypothetical protein
MHQLGAPALCLGVVKVEIKLIIGGLPINERPTEHREKEPIVVAAAQQAKFAVEKLEVGGRADQLKRRQLVLGTGLIDEVADVLSVQAVTRMADGDAEQDKVVLRTDDLGNVNERVGLQIGAMDGEAGDARRVGHPERDQDALAALAPAAIGGGGVGAVAEVAERVEEDRPRRGGIRILGLDRRRDREQARDVHGEILRGIDAEERNWVSD